MRDDSPPQPHTHTEHRAEQVVVVEEESARIMDTQKRICDFCGERKALLYCRPDSAKLCFSCDKEVHSTNQLFTKHTRSLLCDSCDSSPASILCSTENLVLCQNCDWEKHNRSLSSIHERRPLECFSGRPSANELLSIVGLDDDLGHKALYNLSDRDGSVGSWELYGSPRMADELSDFLVWDTPSIMTLGDLIFPVDSDHSFQAMGVPPLPKNRKATCGQHKDEMLCQLRELSKLEPDLNYSNGDTEPLNGFHSVVPKQNLLQRENVYAGRQHDAETTVRPPFGASAFQWCSDSIEAANQVVPSSLLRSYIEETPKDAHKHSVIGGSLNHADASGDHEGQSQDLKPIITGILPVLPKVSQHELTTQDRETAISRYKEKRKSRRYDKHIRYESRKVRAESRIRIKGRFAKMDR